MGAADLARFVALAAIWGSSFLFIKVALDGVSPAQLVLARLIAGAAVLGAVVVVRRGRLPAPGPLWRHLAVMALVANVIPFVLIAWAEVRIPSSLAGVLNATTPFTTALVGLAARDSSADRATWGTAGGVLLGFAGVVLVLAPWSAESKSTWTGEAACLVAAACYGVAFVYSKRFIVGRGASTEGLAAAQLGLAAVAMIIAAPFVARGPLSLDLEVTASILALGGLGTGGAYLLYYGLIANVGATTASMVTYAIPVAAVFLGVVFLDEPASGNLLLGATAVVVGIAVADGRFSRPARPLPVGELDLERD